MKTFKPTISIALIVMLLMSIIPIPFAVAAASRTPVPPAQAPSDAVFIEGETGARSNAWLGTDHAYSGTGFVILDGTRADSKVTYTVNVDSDGEYHFAFNYIAGPVDGWEANRTIKLTVNGQTKTITFSGTPTWDDWTYLMEKVQLTKGANTISLETNGVKNGICVDYLYYWKTEVQASIQSIQYKVNPISVTVDDTYQTAVQALYDDETTGDLNEGVSFSSSDAGIASINAANGLLTAIKAGEVTITATFGDLTAEASVVVNPKNENGIPDNARVIQGESGTLTHGSAQDQSGYTGTGFAIINHVLVPSSATYMIKVGSAGEVKIAFRYAAGAVSGSSNDRTVGLFVNGTKVKDIVFKGTTAWNNWQDDIQAVTLNEGQNTVMLKTDTKGNGIVLDKLTLWKEVTSRNIYAFEFGQSAFQLKEGVTQQVTVNALYTDESMEEVSDELTFGSSDDSVATISDSGLITAVGVGQATITVERDGVKGTAAVTVQAPSIVNVDFADTLEQFDKSMFGYILTPNYDVPDSRMSMLGPIINRETIPVQNLQAVGDGNVAQYQFEESVLERAYEAYQRVEENGLKWYFLLGHHPSWTLPNNNPWGGAPTNAAWFKQYIKDVLQYFKDKGATIDFANLTNEHWTGEEATYHLLWEALREVYPEAVPALGPGGISFAQYEGKKLWIPYASDNGITMEGATWHDFWLSQNFATLPTLQGWADKVKSWQEQYPAANGKYIIWEENNSAKTDGSMWARDMVNVVKSDITHNIKGVIQNRNWNGMSDLLQTNKTLNWQHNPAYRTSMWWVYYMFAQLSGEVVHTSTQNDGAAFTALATKDRNESKIIVVNGDKAGNIQVNLNNQPYSGHEVEVDLYKILPTNDEGVVYPTWPPSDDGFGDGNGSETEVVIDEEWMNRDEPSEYDGLQYQKTIKLDSGDHIHFKVENAAANETWMLVLKKEASAPGFFHPIAPDDGDAALTKPTFKWSQSPGVDSYELTVSSNKDMSNPVFTKTGISGETYTLDTDLTVGTRYYWQVKAINESGSTTPSNNVVYSFIVGENINVPGQFSPFLPSQGFANESVTPRLMWSRAYNAQSYRVVVSKNSDLSDPVIDESNIKRYIDTPQFGAKTAGVLDVTSALEYNTTYYWMVYAVNTHGERTMNGSLRSFSTKAEGLAPTAFKLLKPSNNASEVPTRAVLSWEKPKNSFFYKLEVSPNADMTNPVIVRDRMIYNKYTVEPNLLLPDTTYHWRVTAYTKDLTESKAASNNIFTFKTEKTASSPLLYAEQAGNGTVKLWFQKSVGATSYKIKYGTAPGEYTETITGVTNSPAVVEGLTNGTDYYFAVVAVNDNGESSIWNERKVTPTSRGENDSVFEAEYTAFNGAEADAAHMHFSGTGYVQGQESAEEVSIPFKVTVPTAGFYHVTPRYTAGPADTAVSARMMDLYVNGVKVKNMTFNSTGDWDTWAERQLSLALQAGTNTIEFRATAGNLIKLDNLSISAGTVEVNNQAPELAEIGNKNVQAEANLTFTVSASDPEDDVLLYSAQGLPEGAELNAMTGVFNWIPAAGQEGEYSINFMVEDSSGGTDSEVITIVVGDTSESVKPFSVTSAEDGLIRTEGIKANVTVDLVNQLNNHAGTEHVIFQLFKGKKPVSMVSMETDLLESTDLMAQFHVADPSNKNYKVEVFVYDSFESSEYAPVLLSNIQTLE